MNTIEINYKEYGIEDAIKNAMKADKVEVLVCPSFDIIPFCCDWAVSKKQIKGIADMVAVVDGVKYNFQIR